jgi:hypothetical protein
MQRQPAENAVIVKRLEALYFQLELGRRLAKVVEEPPDPLFAPVGTLNRRHGVDQLEVGGTQPEVRVDIPLVDRSDGSLYDLHVLLRHRPRSISRGRERGESEADELANPPSVGHGTGTALRQTSLVQAK